MAVPFTETGIEQKKPVNPKVGRLFSFCDLQKKGR
jgi:hypothetical protein